MEILRPRQISLLSLSQPSLRSRPENLVFTLAIRETNAPERALRDTAALALFIHYRHEQSFAAGELVQEYPPCNTVYRNGNL